jgi:TPR repeat protein
VENISIDLVRDGLKAYNEEDYKTAFELFLQACDGGDAEGCCSLGVMYNEGKGVK